MTDEFYEPPLWLRLLGVAAILSANLIGLLTK